MSGNLPMYPPPPPYWKKDISVPPGPPTTGLYSMFGRMHTLKEAPLAIETPGFAKRYDDQMLLDAGNYRSELKKMQQLLAECAVRMMETIAKNPMRIEEVYLEYEEILVSFHQLLYKLRHAQAYEEVKRELKESIEQRKAMVERVKNTVEMIAEEVEMMQGHSQ